MLWENKLLVSKFILNKTVDNFLLFSCLSEIFVALRTYSKNRDVNELFLFYFGLEIVISYYFN